MDTQIWYAIFSTIFGGIYGAFRRLGEVSGSFPYSLVLRFQISSFFKLHLFIIDQISFFLTTLKSVLDPFFCCKS